MGAAYAGRRVLLSVSDLGSTGAAPGIEIRWQASIQ
jgi:hypothetical protein